MYNAEWVKIICMAIQLFNHSELKDQATVHIGWIVPDSLGLVAPEQLPAATIRITDLKSQSVLSEYILIPRQNLYQKKTSGDDLMGDLDKTFVTVTPNAVIYRKVLRPILADSIKSLSMKHDSLFYRMIQNDSNQKVIRQEQGFSTDNGLRVIRMIEYPHYIDLGVAHPGTKITQKILTDNLPKNKMIRLSMIPDYGQVHTQWIEQPYHYYDSCVSLTEKTVANIIDSTFSDAVNYGTYSSKNMLYSLCQEQIERAEIPVSCIPSTIKSHWKKIIRQLLLFENYSDPYEDIHRVYPGYEPKMSPDSVLDYMGELSRDISQLPESAIDRLPELVKLYDQFIKTAKKNPGQWNDGNMMLGGNDKEYAPTRDELLLNETGNRIKKIIESEKKEEIARIMKINKIKNKTIRYKHFTFRHTDVMGSGRFTYVDRIVEMKFELMKKE